MSLTARTIYTVGAGRERSHGREAMTPDPAAIIAGFGFDAHSAAPDLSDLGARFVDSARWRTPPARTSPRKPHRSASLHANLAQDSSAVIGFVSRFFFIDIGALSSTSTLAVPRVQTTAGSARGDSCLAPMRTNGSHPTSRCPARRAGILLRQHDVFLGTKPVLERVLRRARLAFCGLGSTRFRTVTATGLGARAGQAKVWHHENPSLAGKSGPEQTAARRARLTENRNIVHGSVAALREIHAHPLNCPETRLSERADASSRTGR
jgi:hypothetical protein